MMEVGGTMVAEQLMLGVGWRFVGGMAVGGGGLRWVAWWWVAGDERRAVGGGGGNDKSRLFFG